MTRIELAVVLGAAFALAALAGWVLHWLWARVTKAGARELAEHSQMAALLHEAKSERDAVREREAELLARMQAERDAEVGDLSSRLAEREAELAATMDTLGDLRQEIARWRATQDGAREAD